MRHEDIPSSHSPIQRDSYLLLNICHLVDLPTPDQPVTFLFLRTDSNIQPNKMTRKSELEAADIDKLVLGLPVDKIHYSCGTPNQIHATRPADPGQNVIRLQEPWAEDILDVKDNE